MEDTAMKVSTLGFKQITNEGFIAAFNWTQKEGTCCLAYGDWTKIGYKLLLTPDQQDFHKNDKEQAEFWSDLDIEICEALIMLPALRNINSVSLYWNGKGKIATDVFTNAQFGVHFFTEYNMHAAANGLDTYIMNTTPTELVKLQVTAIEDGYPTQEIDFLINGAEEYNIFCDMITGMLDVYSSVVTTVA